MCAGGGRSILNLRTQHRYTRPCFYLVVFAYHAMRETNARERQGLILGVGIALIFIARFFIEFVKNVQVDSEEAMRENTGLILGQWLSIPFIVWGIWLIWQALRRKPEPVTQKKSLDYNQTSTQKIGRGVFTPKG